MNVTHVLTLASTLLLAGVSATGCGGQADAAPGAGSTNASATPASAPAAATPAAAKVASCNSQKDMGTCREYGPTHIEARGQDMLKLTCADGVFKLEPCPTAKSVGSCARKDGTDFFYSESSYAFTPETAKGSCIDHPAGGEWKPAK